MDAIGKNSMSNDDFPNKVRRMFEELHSWREESQKEFTTIMNFHSESITKGMHGFVAEIRELKAQVSVMKKDTGDKTRQTQLRKGLGDETDTVMTS